MEDLIQKISLRAYQITQKGKYQIFYKYSAQVNNLEVYYYNDGLWNKDSVDYQENKENKILDVYFDRDNAEKKLTEAWEKLEKIYKEE